MKDENKDQEQHNDQEKKKKTSSAANIDAIISSPTQNVRARHAHPSWGNTGTNISYEGNTAPAGGGSVGTGQASGHDATGAEIHTDDNYDIARVNEKHEQEKNQKEDNNEEARAEHNRNDETDKLKNR